jgi:hypothetical protein
VIAIESWRLSAWSALAQTVDEVQGREDRVSRRTGSSTANRSRAASGRIIFVIDWLPKRITVGRAGPSSTPKPFGFRSGLMALSFAVLTTEEFRSCDVDFVL